MTQVYYEWADPDEFFIDHLSDVSSYIIVNNELRLYYSEDQYFRFRIKDNASVPDGIMSLSSPSYSQPVIYDIYGRRLTQKPEKGVYIENGRKVAIK